MGAFEVEPDDDTTADAYEREPLSRLLDQHLTPKLWQSLSRALIELGSHDAFE